VNPKKNPRLLSLSSIMGLRIRPKHSHNKRELLRLSKRNFWKLPLRENSVRKKRCSLSRSPRSHFPSSRKRKRKRKRRSRRRRLPSLRK
jgi:hypothetical protein